MKNDTNKCRTMFRNPLKYLFSYWFWTFFPDEGPPLGPQATKPLGSGTTKLSEK